MRLRLALAWLLASSALAFADVPVDGGLLRFPDVDADRIVFVYANDLWVVDREGGVARPLASPPGPERFPRFSPDGRHVAFQAYYEGGSDLYVLPVEGGVPRRVTHHPGSERLCDWTERGLLFATGAFEGVYRRQGLFWIDPKGGLPERIPLPEAAFGALSPDGDTLAYTPYSRDFRTWKRYQGGRAGDVWTVQLETGAARRWTDWPGEDANPMWVGRALYFLSDAGPAHRMNVWALDPVSGERRQVTTFTDVDVRFPSACADAIVFRAGASLYLYEPATESLREVEVQIPGERAALRPRVVDAAEFVQHQGISPAGQRVILEARGDLWSLPAERGVAINLTRTSGVAEREPSWSPDGEWIAYTADVGGEYQVWVRPSQGDGPAQALTALQGRDFEAPVWSPDSAHLLVSDHTGALWLLGREGGDPVQVDVHPWAESAEVAWSPDSAWFAYTRGQLDDDLTSVWVYEVSSGQRARVSSAAFDAAAPAFDPDGRYLVYASSLSFDAPEYDHHGATFIYADTWRLVVLPLQADGALPFAPVDDVDPAPNLEEGDPEEGDSEEGDSEEGDSEGGAWVEIDLDGLEARGVVLPVEAGAFSGLTFDAEGRLVYLRRGEGLKVLDLSEDEAEEVHVADVDAFWLSAGGEKALVRTGRGLGVLELGANAEVTSVPVEGLRQVVVPGEEWRQLVTDAWRRHRDYFYVENLHEVDWDACLAQALSLLEHAACREDVSAIIGDMIGELNVGHAYYWGGDHEAAPSATGGVLGCDWAVDPTGFRIVAIHEGAPWDMDARSPLRQGGRRVEVGEVLQAVNGVPVDTSLDPWAALQGQAGQVVRLRVAPSDAPDEAREVLVRCLDNDAVLRYRAWVERQRVRVEARSGGRVGYIHVPDTGRRGQGELLRQFEGQRSLEALLVDERWNGGGQIPTRFVEVLNRPRTNAWARRYGRDWQTPWIAHRGPKAMLINGPSGSGGDMFPYLFRQAGLGPLVGERTWGGLVGITRMPSLIDGGYTAVPTFGFYELDGTWGIEGHGVDPDLPVVEDPVAWREGGRPQLEAAVDVLVRELEANPPTPPARPADPDRRGAGIRPEDR